MNLSDRILASKPRDEIRPNSKFAVALRRRGIPAGQEFRRILALPRRRLADYPADIIETETARYRAPRGSMSLWREQAICLHELRTLGGLFAPLAVGRGKALVSLLAATALDAKRPLLLVPAQLRDQTNAHVLPAMRRHWRIADNLAVRGYSELSVVSGATMLDDLQPDLVVFDEAHNIKNAAAGRTKRVARYLKDHPETRVVILSGTITRKSLRDYWALIQWALGPQASPLPTKWNDLQDWANHFDLEVPDENRVAAGAVARHLNDGETSKDWLRRRLTETPAVVASSEQELATGLEISADYDLTTSGIRARLKALRDTWETPDGDLITEAIQLWQHARELAMGFCYRWKHAPPEGWMQARRDWKSYVRDVLKHNRSGLDTELQVARKESQSLKPAPQWVAWAKVKDTFTPETVPVWFDDFVVQQYAAMVRASAEPVLAWIEHTAPGAFGERLAKLADVPFFGAGMEAASRVLTHSASCVLSYAHAEGKNLQHYSQNIVCCPPTSGKLWEQLLGRTHRAGQLADVVSVRVNQSTAELRNALRSAVGEARHIQATAGIRQKLGFATFTFDIASDGPALMAAQAVTESEG